MTPLIIKILQEIKMRASSIEKTRLHKDHNYQVMSTSHFMDSSARKAIFEWLGHISTGYLIIDEGENHYAFGDPKSELTATVTICSAMTYRDVLFNGLVGAGEAYMRGAWVSNDVVSVVRVLSANLTAMQSRNGFLASINQSITGLVHRLFRKNNKANSRLNIAAHYDLGNDFFRLFLDPSMMYSSAIFPNENASLDEAATYKLEHICQRLRLNEADHLLEIGTGWGGMAIYAAKNYGCRVTTTTISREQYDYATVEVKKAGVENLVTLLLDDYRELEGKFDKLVSIEMIEAVGQQYYQQYFSACSHLLKEDGLMLIQAITVPDQRYEITKKSTDFIQQYIFPGGELPSIQVMSKHVMQDTDMQVVGIDDITLDYANTLAAWRQRFFEKLDDVKAQGFDDIFIRMWDFYLAYCEGGFRERTISTVQLVMAKPRCQLLPVVTRDD
jgi:cyclopropane-fatty-acyl-phospholipid synthase